MPIGGEGLNMEVAYAMAFFVETLLYGIYACLFIAAVPAIARGRRSAHRERTSAWVFLLTTIAMFAVATAHIAVVVYRSLRSTVLLNDPLGASHYLMDVCNWEILANIILICIMTWLGDALVIYRAYIVWNRNLWLISLPVCLLLASICVNSYVLVWLKHPLGPIPFKSGLAAFNSIYILSFIQNLMTTGLITLKIWTQHRASLASGVVDRGSHLSLIRVARIIVESAMVYTLQLLVIIILNFRHNNFQYIVQCAIVPSIGITFVLIAVRVQLAKGGDREIRMDVGMGERMPTWLDGGDDGVESTTNPDDSAQSGTTEAKGDPLHTDEESITWSTAEAPQCRSTQRTHLETVA